MDQRLPLETELVKFRQKLFERVGGCHEVFSNKRHPFPLMRVRVGLEPVKLRAAVDAFHIASPDARRRQDFAKLRIRREKIAGSVEELLCLPDLPFGEERPDLLLEPEAFVLSAVPRLRSRAHRLVSYSPSTRIGNSSACRRSPGEIGTR